MLRESGEAGAVGVSPSSLTGELETATQQSAHFCDGK